jgi:hypothetical protein
MLFKEVHQHTSRMSSTYSTSSENDDEVLEFMRLIARPAQFYSSENPNTAGKTSTAITEMEAMIHKFLDMAIVANSSLITPVKRIVHIFVNNSLIEGDQWAGRLVSRGLQKMRIFSSKSDVNNADALYTLINEGQYDEYTKKYIPINYVLQCTHPVRLSDYCDDKRGYSGVVPSILKRMGDLHPHVGFVIWGDEIDKLTGLWKQYIPKLRNFTNVLQFNGITATPYTKYWELMHSLGFYNVPLIGSLPDTSEYITISNHKHIYTDIVTMKSPVINFEYLLDHPGEICYTETDTETKKEIIRHTIPDLKSNTGKVYYVPGEEAIATHDAISDIATRYKKNSLVINGKSKEFRYADGRPPVSIKDYKKKKIAAGLSYTDSNGKKIPFVKMAAMDIAICMFNDPELGLKATDLVITGYNCITRGITFNRPDFQFSYMILAGYHYKEGSKQMEEVIQAVGRGHGNASWVKAGIVFLSPKHILEMVEEKIKQQIEHLRTAPKELKYADAFREPKGIPIKVLFHNTQIINRIREFKQLTEKRRTEFMGILREGVRDGSITLHDQNSEIPSQVKFSFDEYIIQTKRMLEDVEKAKSYRFPEFLEKYNKRMSYGQSIKEEGKFNIDITFIEQKLSDTEIVQAGTGFISFMFKTKPI